MLLIILDLFADTHDFEGDFAYRLAVGRHAGGSIKFEAIFVFGYANTLK